MVLRVRWIAIKYNEVNTAYLKNRKKKDNEQTQRPDNITREESLYVTKTRLLKHIENCTSKNLKFSDKNFKIFHISAQNARMIKAQLLAEQLVNTYLF